MSPALPKGTNKGSEGEKSGGEPAQWSSILRTALRPFAELRLSVGPKENQFSFYPYRDALLRLKIQHLTICVNPRPEQREKRAEGEGEFLATDRTDRTDLGSEGEKSGVEEIRFDIPTGSRDQISLDLKLWYLI